MCILPIRQNCTTLSPYLPNDIWTDGISKCMRNKNLDCLSQRTTGWNDNILNLNVTKNIYNQLAIYEHHKDRLISDMQFKWAKWITCLQMPMHILLWIFVFIPLKQRNLLHIWTSCIWLLGIHVHPNVMHQG